MCDSSQCVLNPQWNCSPSLTSRTLLSSRFTHNACSECCERREAKESKNRIKETAAAVEERKAKTEEMWEERFSEKGKWTLVDNNIGMSAESQRPKGRTEGFGERGKDQEEGDVTGVLVVGPKRERERRKQGGKGEGSKYRTEVQYNN